MISIIVAIAQNRVIGRDNSLIWHLSEDLKYFKKTTSGHTIIMGRKSYESIGRALPNRRNIIVTRNLGYKAEGCEIAHSVEEAIALCSENEEAFIIGGGEIYNISMPLVSRLYITEIENSWDGDTYFPEIDKSIWIESERIRFERGEKFEYPFSFVIYNKY